MPFRIGWRTIKTAIGAAVAMFIAQQMHIQVWPLAGLVAVLSIQTTTKSSFRLGFNRILAVGLVFLVTLPLMLVFHFSPLALGFSLLIFIPLAVMLDLQNSIFLAVTLATHILLLASAQNTLKWQWIQDDFSVLLIGVGVALCLNLFMPKWQNQVSNYQTRAETLLAQVLESMHEQLTRHGSSQLTWDNLSQYKEALDEGYFWAVRVQENQLLLANNFYTAYFQMRTTQYDSLRQMQQCLDQLPSAFAYTDKVVMFLQEAQNYTGAYADSQGLLKSLTLLQEEVAALPLPADHEQLQTRIYLTKFVLNFKMLVAAKVHFLEVVTAQNKH